MQELQNILVVILSGVVTWLILTYGIIMIISGPTLANRFAKKVWDGSIWIISLLIRWLGNFFVWIGKILIQLATSTR